VPFCRIPVAGSRYCFMKSEGHYFQNYLQNQEIFNKITITYYTFFHYYNLQFHAVINFFYLSKVLEKLCFQVLPKQGFNLDIRWAWYLHKSRVMDNWMWTNSWDTSILDWFYLWLWFGTILHCLLLLCCQFSYRELPGGFVKIQISAYHPHKF
jgi:hypothetical protein